MHSKDPFRAPASFLSLSVILKERGRKKHTLHCILGGRAKPWLDQANVPKKNNKARCETQMYRRDGTSETPRKLPPPRSGGVEWSGVEVLSNVQGMGSARQLGYPQIRKGRSPEPATIGECLPLATRGRAAA